MKKKFLETRRDFCVNGHGEMLSLYSFLGDISLVHQVVSLVFTCVFSLSLFFKEKQKHIAELCLKLEETERSLKESEDNFL